MHLGVALVILIGHVVIAFYAYIVCSIVIPIRMIRKKAKPHQFLDTSL